MTTRKIEGVPEVKEDLEVALARARLDLARERTRRSLSEVQSGLAKSFDWRDWVREHPDLAIAGAFIAGFLVGHRR